LAGRVIPNLLTFSLASCRNNPSDGPEQYPTTQRLERHQLHAKESRRSVLLLTRCTPVLQPQRSTWLGRQSSDSSPLFELVRLVGNRLCCGSERLGTRISTGLVRSAVTYLSRSRRTTIHRPISVLAIAFASDFDRIHVPLLICQRSGVAPALGPTRRLPIERCLVCACTSLTGHPLLHL
jgi:hypothetical protein